MMDSLLLIDEFSEERMSPADASNKTASTILSGPKNKLNAMGYRIILF